MTKTQLHDVASAAEYLSVSPRMVRRLIYERRIAVVRVGKHVRLSEKDLDDFLIQSREEAVSPKVRKA